LVFWLTTRTGSVKRVPPPADAPVAPALSTWSCTRRSSSTPTPPSLRRLEATTQAFARPVPFPLMIRFPPALEPLEDLSPAAWVEQALKEWPRGRPSFVRDFVPPAFEAYESAAALERTEAFFWSFCDAYLELVKGRAYGEAGRSGQVSALRALRLALETQLLLFAPVLERFHAVRQLVQDGQPIAYQRRAFDCRSRGARSQAHGPDRARRQAR